MNGLTAAAWLTPLWVMSLENIEEELPRPRLISVPSVTIAPHLPSTCEICSMAQSISERVMMSGGPRRMT